MSFQPVVPLSGYVGWRFLERTMDAQQEAFNTSQPIARATDYFRENIAQIRTADDLVADRQLLSVALGAFGLDEDINNTAFIRKVLSDGTTSDDALANRLADNRYADFSRTFGFGNLEVLQTIGPGFADDIIDRFESQRFAQAVGDQNNDLRLALNVADGLETIFAQNSTNTGRWFAIMGNAPIREVFQTALGLPSGIASIDVDKQREIFAERAQSVLGSEDVGALSDPAEQEKLIRLFLVRSEAEAISFNSSSANALALLTN